ncbi:MAG TPA: ferritin-like domain-containing protein, partial [Polyangiaceae bacterium]|nr:ferritin-like domain-containing protein [Polyangiaceae bacterium]
VEAEARVAPVVGRGDWGALAVAMPRLDHLTASERAVLAEHWTRLGQLEHASIAAFARFSLQLLSLGAPPELVEACTRALGDETAHTRLCFRLASAYAGRDIGPGPLDVSGSLEVTSLADIVDLVIAEGCFGETSAALDALDAADSASDPVIAAAYAQIAADEQRHAELAFQFVRWALGRAPHSIALRVSAAISAPPSAEPGVSSVAVPCLQALLAA